MSLDGLPALLGADPTDPETVKACCATAYGNDLVALFLGDSYHPGGVDLTRRLAQLMGLQPGDTVLDVASGPGTTAVLLAVEDRVDVVGVDLGSAQNAKARAKAERLGLSDRVRFEIGDAERLPIDDAGVDAVICECALCTFPDKTTAVDEMARVLRPGGRLGISDVWLDPAHLDPDLQGIAGRVACLADARPIPEIRALIEHAGLEVTNLERHDDALLATIDQIQTRLRALRIADLPLLQGFDLRRGIDLALRAADMVRRGHAGYMMLTATKR
ncbi:MAG: class I SAM-dependent methyltransferase [Acidimicrobiales bacterium]